MSGEAIGHSATSTLLATKFLPPVPGRGYLRRGRLHQRMAQGASTPLTLLSAPAGFGKTSVLAGWLSELEAPWAWLSIDRQDNDPGRLWSHLIAALQRLAGPIGETALIELRRRGGRGPVDAWLTPLINDMVASTAPSSFLVLDDLHLLTDAEQREGIGRLTANLPAWLHLVIASRSDPPLPLPRLRADGRITEVREADLRFVPVEASSLLAAGGTSHLGVEQVHRLVERTEGWAAGLQLATITLGDDADDARLDEIVGSLRPFTDYLITEVVDHQRPQMRSFLYTTAIVDRINPSLARIVSGQPDADRLLREAERQGLFLMALDGRDEWYRYHHLFAEALRHEMRVRDPLAAADAHGAAAQWFELHGETATALEHWLAAERPEEALRLAVDVAFTLVDRGQAVTIEAIARRIPSSVPGSDPARQLAYGLLHAVFEPETFLAWVGHATATIEGMGEPDHDLRTQYLTVRSMADLSIGAWAEAFDHASRAVTQGRTLQSPSGYGQRAQVQVIRAAGWLERLDDAERNFTAYIDDPRTPEPLRVMVAPAAWALAAAIAGCIDVADHWSQRSAAAADLGFHSMFSMQDLLLTHAIVARERGEEEAAATAIELLCSLEVKPNLALHAMALVELALVRLDQWRLKEADEALDTALNVRGGRPLGPLVVGRVDAVRSAICHAGGDATGARRAAERMPKGLWKEVTMARSLVLDDELEAADALLAPLVPETPRQRVTVEMLRALAHRERDPAAARQHAATAAGAAVTSGMRQSLLTVGPGATDLLDSVSWAVPAGWMERAHVAGVSRNRQPGTGRIAHLVEQPTERELDAARFLPSRLTVPEIAQELGLSTNTVKSHFKSLYRKLGVTSRDEAVDVARELGILR